MTRLIHPLSPILGKEAALFAHLTDRIVPQLDGVRYEFASVEEMKRYPVPQMNQIYWAEILYRAHWAASGTLIRAQKWFSAIQASYSQANLLSFAASARGLIEAAADSHHGLKTTPLTLARDHVMVRSAVEGTLLAPTVNPELEERLIHFTHATKKPTTGQASHQALPVAEYRAPLDNVEPRVRECYQHLCDLTHPGAWSILSYAQPETPDASIVRLSLQAERQALDELRANLLHIMPAVLTLGLNGALVTLKVLNVFPLQAIQTPLMNDIDLTQIPLWQKVAALLEAAA